MQVNCCTFAVECVVSSLSFLVVESPTLSMVSIMLYTLLECVADGSKQGVYTQVYILLGKLGR
jgi:hypothetical protein